MRTLVASSLIILIAVSAGGAGGEKKGKDKGADGTWIVVGMVQNGMKASAEDLDKLKMTLTVKGSNYTVSMAGMAIDKGTSKADETKKPITLDIKSEEGPNKGKTILAIVEIDGDSMKTCYDLEGKNRPKEFSAKEGSGHVLILYKRETKKKDE